ncbi:MAG: NAD(P)-binding protein, partial [Hyphomonadaceae bacterium]|nr:NAD(P)-binding protein [Hyphomonadaceae bacterium]
MNDDRAIVVGAGIGGLSAALRLASAGYAVTVLERAGAAGGKMREVEVAGAAIDAGPTVLTMRWVFEELFTAAGSRLKDHVALQPLSILARHAWTGGAQLDLFADEGRSADAIGAFAGGSEARGYLAFCAEGRRMYETLREPFLAASKPNPITLTGRIGLTRLPDLLAIRPFDTMWKALSDHFKDPRLRQLF